ncbi:MAG: aminopeptidase P family protein, partial [Alphaproteobacteria bacterium]|nr:aminopeptidase P family protein [Alphaproteobacteria bacterium]
AEVVPYRGGGAGQGGYGDVISPPSNEPLRAGDVLMLDTGATLAGYFCDFDRNFAFGHASDEAKYAYGTLYRATEAALRTARPGVLCRDLYAAMLKTIDQDGSDVGRFGHGLGLQLTEPPSLISFDDTPLQAGMVITLEPSMTVCEDKIMVHEENIVIRDGPPELLTRRAPSELPIL